jgi:cytochrome c biogenesis protein CcmG, thiol:disulfide interchange protein DsbE
MQMLKTLACTIVLMASATAWGSPLEGLEPMKGTPSENHQIPANANRLLISFWATWCKDCVRELKVDLIDLQKEARNRAVIAVNIDQDPERAVHWVEKNGITIPVYRDKAGKLKKALKVFSVPFWAVYKKSAANQWELVDSASAFDLDRVRRALNVAR